MCPSSDSRPELPLDPDGMPSRILHLQPAALLLVAAGGFAGTLARYGLSQAEPTRARAWPWGTFLANVIGAFVLGMLLEALARRGPDEGWRQRIRLLAGTGFCGAFTTYSALAVETDLLVRDARPALAAEYLAATVLLGLLATVLGLFAAGRVRGPAGPQP
jgi:fluoride exporter